MSLQCCTRKNKNAIFSPLYLIQHSSTCITTSQTCSKRLCATPCTFLFALILYDAHTCVCAWDRPIKKYKTASVVYPNARTTCGYVSGPSGAKQEECDTDIEPNDIKILGEKRRRWIKINGKRRCSHGLRMKGGCYEHAFYWMLARKKLLVCNKSAAYP